jgi:hypothetical protein
LLVNKNNAENGETLAVGLFFRPIAQEQKKQAQCLFYETQKGKELLLHLIYFVYCRKNSINVYDGLRLKRLISYDL